MTRRRKLDPNDLLDRKIAAVRVVTDEAYNLFDDICDMLGGPYGFADDGMSPERLMVFREVHDQPRYCAARRKAIWEATR